MALVVVLGGARSGKSALAQRLAAATDAAVTVIATAEARDDEMAERIARAGLVGRPGGLRMLVAAGALSRGAAVVLGAAVPYARVDDGTGKVLVDRASSASVWCAGALAVGIAWAAGGVRGLVGAAAVAAAAALWGWRCRRRLGGITGDTLGAAVEGAEAIVLLVGLAFR